MTSTPTVRRWVHLDGAVNVRDVGDLPTSDGGTTAPGRLLRADNLQSLTDADVRRLVQDLGVRLVVDLRTGVEVRSEGPGRLSQDDAVAHVHLSLFPEGGDNTDFAADDVLPWQRGDARARATPGQDGAAGYYLGYLRDRPDNIVAALRAITRQVDGAALVHCAAGKDRTGVVIALALSVAGVQREAIIDDYVATADVLPQLVARLEASPTYAEDVSGRSLDSHRPIAANMERFLGTLDARYGDPLGWLDEHGFAADEQDALRRRLVT
ncbi:MAG: tyrosine-protein phosphatase [Geodermatophilaceae bacterium]